MHAASVAMSKEVPGGEEMCGDEIQSKATAALWRDSGEERASTM